MLDALAKAHDPHSAYLTAEALARVRSEIHDAAPDAMRVRGRVVEHGDARIGLMVVPSFSLHADRSTSSDAAYVIQALSTQGVDVLVLDMRGNTGGVQSEAAKLVALFAGPGPVAQTVTANGALDILSAEADAVWTDPLVVVVDTMSASMAEVAVAALQDRGHALVVGQRTHGKGTGQTLVLLSSPHGGRDGAVRVTDRRFHRLDGRPLQQLGVTPDVVLPSSTAIASERDRIDALTFDAIPAITAPPPLRGAPSTEAFPFSAALSWLRAEGLPSLAP
jgi:carboxyl-terminal processing protease